MKNTTRREFLQGSAGAVAGLATSGLTIAPARKAHAGAPPDKVFTFSAQPFAKTLIDGTSVPIWRFNDGLGQPLGALTAALNLVEGELVEITVFNDLLSANGGRPINLAIPGVALMQSAASISPDGGMGVYSFTAPVPGSYLFYDDFSGELGRAMGLLGSMIVTAFQLPGNLYAGGPAFDRQYPLVVHELDDRLNQMIDDNVNVDFDTYDYEPNYFFLNGISTPDTMVNSDTLITMNVGESIALRFVNAGLIVAPMHSHGYHINVITRDRVSENVVVEKDVVLVKPGECVDAILPCDQEGEFLLHTHYVPATQANGIYVNPFGGAVTLMVAGPAP